MRQISSFLHMLLPMCLIGVIAFTSTANHYQSHQVTSSPHHRVTTTTSTTSKIMISRGGSSTTRLFHAEELVNPEENDSAANATFSTYTGGMLVDPALNRKPMKVLFLSADTGGGHRASAESLAKQFLIHYPGSQYDLLDVWTHDGVVPYRTLVKSYKHLSAHPRQWRILFHLSNTRLWSWGMDKHSALMCERRIRRRMASYKPDVVVSVHPTMNGAPLIATHKIAKGLGKHIPFFTVVTDLGSAHGTWFSNKVDKVYVASDRLYNMAKRRAKTPDEKIVRTGLPIRFDFAVQAEQLGDRTSEQGKAYQSSVRTQLGLSPDKPMVLLMGGGEGVGSLAAIAENVYSTFAQRGIDATICVVCGRNEKLKTRLAERDWSKVVASASSSSTPRRRRFRLFGRRRQTSAESSARANVSGNITVVPLGFVTNMAEYMTAADVLISKAGPGTLAEAAAVGLPVMMTSFLPGQEAGNVDFVLESGFGAFQRKPVDIAEEVARWVQHPDVWAELSQNAREAGKPHAAAEIVLDIGSTTQTWMALNDGDITTSVSMSSGL